MSETISPIALIADIEPRRIALSVILRQIQEKRSLPALSADELAVKIDTWTIETSEIPTDSLAPAFAHLCTYADFAKPIPASALRQAWKLSTGTVNIPKGFESRACRHNCVKGFHIVLSPAKWAKGWKTAARGCVCELCPVNLRSKTSITEAGYVCGSAGNWAKPSDLSALGDYNNQFWFFFKELQGLESDGKE
jgi:hypothetical protein